VELSELELQQGGQRGLSMPAKSCLPEKLLAERVMARKVSITGEALSVNQA
jgi:hypothetical protein